MDVRENINGNSRIMDVPACQLNVNWVSKSIHNSMDFGCLSTMARSNKLVVFAVYSPFLAPAL